jgi:uncharacterized protein (PEP-CTERM system associated)
MADRLPARHRRGLRAGLCCGVALGCVVAMAAGAQPLSPGMGPLGLFGSSLAPPGPIALPGGVDSSRFWLPQVYPDFPTGPAPPGAPGQMWSIVPSLELQLGATDNVRNTSGNRESDLFTVIRPRLTLAADSSWLVGALTYAPSIRNYLNASDLNRIDHSLGAQGTLTLVDDLLYVEGSASSDARSVFGEFGELGGLGSDVFARTNRVQGTSYRISPYVVQRFGGWASGRLGYAFAQGDQGGRAAFLPGQSQPFFVQQDLTSHEFYGSLSSGENWDRLGWDLRSSFRDYDGSGVYDGAHRNFHVLAARYQLTREFSLTGELGWQDERYAGVRPFSIEEPIWSVGFRVAPDPDSFLSIRYGKRDGENSFSVDGGMMIGVRTRLVVNYSEEITAPFARAGGLAASLRVDQFGNIVDAVTGLPVSLTDPRLSATQSSVFRTKRGVAAASQAWIRDTLTLALIREERTPVASPAGISGFAQDTTALTLGWTRELEPGLSLNTAGRVGVTDTQGTGEENFYSFQAGLAQAFSPTLAGTVQYQFTARDPETGGRTTQNMVIVTLRQLF